MVNILYENDDITVLGSPAQIEVSLDIGPTGKRGSQIFTGIGNPNSINIGQTPLVNDWFINSAAGSGHTYMYQYQSKPGGLTWVPVIDLQPTLYSKIRTVAFTAGSGSDTIPLSDIKENIQSPTSSMFVVRYSIEGTNAIASSFEIPTLVGTPPVNLIINYKAFSYNGSTWSGLSGNQKIHTLITLAE